MPDSPQRRTERLALFVAVELFSLQTLERLRAWTGNVSRGGCFVRAEKPFAVWTRVRIQLARGDQFFHAEGTVVHSQAGEGMGIAFEDVPAEQQAVLDSWLADSQHPEPNT